MLVLAVSFWNKMNKSTKLYFTKYKKKKKKGDFSPTYLFIFIILYPRQHIHDILVSVASQLHPMSCLHSCPQQRGFDSCFPGFMISDNLFHNLTSGLEGDIWPLRKDLLVFFVCVFYSKYCFKIFIQYLFCVGKAMNARFYFTLS